jgi:hypothetical protein
MRKILNKQFTNDDILDRATLDLRERHPEPEAVLHGRTALGDTRGVEAIVDLTEQIRERMLEVARKRGRVGRIHPSVNPFVPKPGRRTSGCRWRTRRRPTASCSSCARRSGRCPNVDAICKSARTGVSQSILAPGDRRVGDALELGRVEGVDLKRGHEGRLGSTAPSTCSADAARRGAALGHRATTGVSKRTTCASWTRARARSLSPHCPSSRAASAAACCEEARIPATSCPRSGSTWDRRLCT